MSPREPCPPNHGDAARTHPRTDRSPACCVGPTVLTGTFCTARPKPPTRAGSFGRGDLRGAPRRSGKSGEPYSMRDTDGESMSSWPLTEFHQAWSDLAVELMRGLLSDEP